MVRRSSTAVIGIVLALVGVGAAGSAASAASTMSLVVSQSTAFSVLGHSCGGIQEQAFATGFDPTSGFPVGDVHLQTRCGGSGRGGGYHSTTYAAWVGVTWDFTGALVSYGVLSAAPPTDPGFSAFDDHGNEVANIANNAYLTLAPTFVPAPRVTGVSVSSGPASGGTTLTITGTGFTGATGVTFGGTPAASFVINGDVSIVAVTGQGPAGTIDVTVTSAGGTSVPSATDHFTYIAAPSVTRLSPNRGPIAGGTAVTIAGAHLGGAVGVAFGDTRVGFTVNSDSSITAVSPVGETPDAVHVTVTTSGGTSATSATDQFTYNAPRPTLSVSPRSGAPGAAINVSGNRFTAGETVKVSYMTGLRAPHVVSVALCHARAAANGTFACKAHAPKTGAGARGAHKIIGSGTTPLTKASAVFTVT